MQIFAYLKLFSDFSLFSGQRLESLKGPVRFPWCGPWHLVPLSLSFPALAFFQIFKWAVLLPTLGDSNMGFSGIRFLGYYFTWLTITGILLYLVNYRSCFELRLNGHFLMEVFLAPRQVSFWYSFIALFLLFVFINLSLKIILWSWCWYFYSLLWHQVHLFHVWGVLYLNSLHGI